MSAVMTKQPWLQTFQKQQLQHFMQRGLPTRKEEAWKYTSVPANLFDQLAVASQASVVVDVAQSSVFDKANLFIEDQILLVFVNGVFSASLSQINNLPEGVTLIPLSQALVQENKQLKIHLLKEFSDKQYPFAVLNSALMTEGLFLHIPKNVQLSAPIHSVFITTQQNNIQIQPRNIIVVDEGATVSVIEEYISDAKDTLTNVVTEIIAERNSQLDFYKIQTESLSATHISNIFIQQMQDSRVNIFTLANGSRLSREDIVVKQAQAGAESNLLGLYTMQHDDQHTDHHLSVAHAAEHGISSMLYKGILAKKSRAVFNGKVYVHPGAQHINALQANHNILLSPNAEVNTKPELEIYADNVKCAHGATVGQLDAEILFYCRSRGIDKATAIMLLLNGFADEVISKIKNTFIRQYIQQRVGVYVEL